ncbi:MAG: UDP-N-acetylmuramate dehydrogenase, partial [Myxococcota bacterium]
MGALPSTWRSQVPLAPLTTLQVGGPAQYYVETRSTDELLETLRVADRQRLAVTVLGGGSNVLISDDGIDGVVIRQRDVRVEPLSQRRVRVSAGTEWDPFVHWAVQHGLAGLECLSGIPGQVGAAPIQNVGAYGRDVSEVLRSVTVVNRSDGSVSEMSAEACEFGYRSSVFKSHRDRYLVTAVTFELAESSTCELRYRDLLAEFP